MAAPSKWSRALTCQCSSSSLRSATRRPSRMPSCMRRRPAANTSTSPLACSPANKGITHDPEACPPASVPAGVLHSELLIVNRKGLHARASAKFVQTVERYDALVTVTRCGETVGGRSIMGLLTLGAAQGTSIAVTAVGTDAEACLATIEALLAAKFGEDE